MSALDGRGWGGGRHGASFPCIYIPCVRVGNLSAFVFITPLKPTTVTTAADPAADPAATSTKANTTAPDTNRRSTCL